MIRSYQKASNRYETSQWSERHWCSDAVGYGKKLAPVIAELAIEALQTLLLKSIALRKKVSAYCEKFTLSDIVELPQLLEYRNVPTISLILTCYGQDFGGKPGETSRDTRAASFRQPKKQTRQCQNI